MIKKIILFVSIFFVIIISPTYASNWKVKILKVDTSAYPRIAADFVVFEDKAKVVKGINKNDIKILEGARKIQDIDLQYKSSTAELRLAILLDVSGSMRGEKFENAKNSIIELFNVISTNNKAALFTFGSEINPISNFTSDFNFLVNAIESIDKLSPKTRLYDGLLEVTSLFSAIENTRNAVILITDGKDDGSYSELQESLNNAKKNNVEVFSIGIGNKADLQTLGKISYQTGAGYGGIIEPGELRYVLQNIYELLTKNYEASFFTPDSIVQIPSTVRKLGLSVAYKGFEKKIMTEFVVPKYNPYKDINWVYFVVIGFILLSLILLIVAIINSRSNSKEEVSDEEEYFGLEDDEYDQNAAYDEDSDFDGDGETNYEDWEGDFKKNVQDQKTVIISRGKFKTDKSLGYLAMRSKKFGMHIYEIKQKELIIGRSAEADILLEDDEVSKLHTKVRFMGSSFVVDDLGSSNGTLVNGNEEYHRELVDGDIIKIGEHEFVFKCID